MRATRTWYLLVTVCIVSSAGPNNRAHGQAMQTTGFEIYEARCASCHENAAFKAPPAASLGTMSQTALMAALMTGPMAVQAAELSHADKIALVETLTQRDWQTQSMSEDAYCNHQPRASEEILWSGWGGDIRSTGNSALSEINRDNIDTLEVAWVFGFPGATRSRSQPTVVGNRVVVGSQLGQVFSLDLDLGCIHWIFEANSAIRGAISSAKLGTRTAVFFADFRANVYAVDIVTGEAIWQTSVGHTQYSSVTGSVTVADDRIFVPIASTEVIAAADSNHVCCTSSGAVVAVSKEDGKLLWRHRTIPPTDRTDADESQTDRIPGRSGAPVWSSPTVDTKRGLVYVGTGQTSALQPVCLPQVSNGLRLTPFQNRHRDLGAPDNCPPVPE